MSSFRFASGEIGAVANIRWKYWNSRWRHGRRDALTARIAAKYSASRLYPFLFREIGPARNRFPRNELVAQVFELFHGAVVSIVAKQ